MTHIDIVPFNITVIMIAIETLTLHLLVKNKKSRLDRDSEIQLIHIYSLSLLWHYQLQSNCHAVLKHSVKLNNNNNNTFIIAIFCTKWYKTVDYFVEIRGSYSLSSLTVHEVF